MSPASTANRSLRRRARRPLLALLVVAWLAAFTLTHIPLPQPIGLPTSDKTAHLIGYAGLATLLWAVLWSHDRSAGTRMAACLVGLAVYGAFDELTQPLVNRHADVADWIFNVAGTALAVAILETLTWTRTRRAARKHAALKKPAARRVRGFSP